MYVNAFDVVHVCAPFHPVLSRTGDHHEAAASYIYYTTANTRLQTHVLFFPYSCRNSETPTLTNREGKVHAQAIHPLPVHSQGPYFRPTNC
jgi:hypothetical protein